jgi:hypothetical protein
MVNGNEFSIIIEKQIDRCKKILGVKAGEYATDADRLHNFKIAAALQGITPLQALAGMMAKHTVSVYDLACSGRGHPQALWDEKITDSINYLLLLAAMVKEA